MSDVPTLFRQIESVSARADTDVQCDAWFAIYYRTRQERIRLGVEGRLLIGAASVPILRFELVEIAKIVYPPAAIALYGSFGAIVQENFRSGTKNGIQRLATGRLPEPRRSARRFASREHWSRRTTSLRGVAREHGLRTLASLDVTSGYIPAAARFVPQESCRQPSPLNVRR